MPQLNKLHHFIPAAGKVNIVARIWDVLHNAYMYKKLKWNLCSEFANLIIKSSEEWLQIAEQENREIKSSERSLDLCK